MDIDTDINREVENKTKSSCWHALEMHAQAPRKALKQQEKNFMLTACHLTLNYNYQTVTDTTLSLLISLANACQLREKTKALMTGEIINTTESRPALHTALRASDNSAIDVDGQNIMPLVIKVRNQIKQISDQIRAKEWLGYSGKPITDIVNIGIGGSDLGPRFCLDALKKQASDDLNYHFVSDIDPYSLEAILPKIKPETTLVIIASKSFTTQETLYNAKRAKAWFENNPIEQHFIAVTAKLDKAYALGIQTVLPIWDWVGGRFSLCSAINLITAIAIGYDSFKQMLSGAEAMDKHFLNTDFQLNMPVILGLIGIWNNNFLHIDNLLILTYARKLEQFTAFIQQLDMESNGKSVDRQGHQVQHATGPIVWGGLGNQAQHSYYQLLCQGTHRVTADLISVDSKDKALINTMCKRKLHVLTQGIQDAQNPYACIEGNMPLNHINMHDYSPFTVGAIVALYEHKIFTQSVIWNINPFDQPGVESAKSLQIF